MAFDPWLWCHNRYNFSCRTIHSVYFILCIDQSSSCRFIRQLKLQLVLLLTEFSPPLPFCRLIFATGAQFTVKFLFANENCCVPVNFTLPYFIWCVCMCVCVFFAHGCSVAQVNNFYSENMLLDAVCIWIFHGIALLLRYYIRWLFVLLLLLHSINVLLAQESNLCSLVYSLYRPAG